MDLNFVWGGAREKNLVKAVFMSVYRRLAANSIQNQVENGEVSQNLLARIFRKVAFPKSLLNVISLHFSMLATTKKSKVLEF